MKTETVMVEMPFRYPDDAQLYHKDLINAEGRVRKTFNQTALAELAMSIQTFGLLHPPTISDKGVLIGGERRFRAITEVLGSEYVPVNVISNINKADIKELELDENFKRADFTWQERVLGIHNLHATKAKARIRMGKTWRQKDTADLLGLSDHSHVSHTLQIAKFLLEDDKEIWAAMNATAALEIIMRRKEQEALAIAEAKLRVKSPHVVFKQPSTTSGSLGSLDDLQDLTKPTPKMGGVAPVSKGVDKPSSKPVRVNMSEWLHLGDSLELMKAMKPESFDHIVTDPPYGIEIETMGLKNAVEIEDTHDVKENMDLLKRLMPLAFKVLKPGGFFAFWYDNIHWEMLYKAALKAGFVVQRWPIVWCKTHNCKNQSATFNYTKATEFAMVCRKKGATLVERAGKNFFTADGSIERKMYSNPFAKPADAWNFLLKHIVHPGQTVLDPFMGQGSAIRAILNHGAVPYGIEIDEAHFNKCRVDTASLLKEIHGNVIIE